MTIDLLRMKHLIQAITLAAFFVLPASLVAAGKGRELAIPDFSAYLWNFVDGKPLQSELRSMSEIPAKTPLAEKMSKDLQKRGFRFVGPTIVYAFMQACGLVNDHLVTCHRHEAVKHAARS